MKGLQSYSIKRDAPVEGAPVYFRKDGSFDWDNAAKMDLGSIFHALVDLNERLKAIEARLDDKGGSMSGQT